MVPKLFVFSKIFRFCIFTAPAQQTFDVGWTSDRRQTPTSYDVGFRLILKVCLTSKTDVILTSKTDVILTSEKQRWFDVSNVTS